MAVTKYQFLDETGVQTLATNLLGKVNLRIDERIVDSMDASSDENHVLSAKAVYELIGGAEANGDGSTIKDELANLNTELDALDSKVTSLTHLEVETVTGDIGSVLEPSTSKLYFQRDTEDDNTWNLYIYRMMLPEGEPEGEPVPTWVCVGDTSIDLVNYWRKDDIESMRTALSIHDAEALEEAKITAAVEAAYAAATPTM